MKKLHKSSGRCWWILAQAAGVALVWSWGHSTAASARPFAAFDAELEIDIEDGEVELTATFALAAGDDKLDPVTEATALRLKGGSGDFSLKLPPGAFERGRNGTFQFRGNIEGAKLLAALRPLRAGTFELEIVTEGAGLSGMANPVTVTLQIGPYSGSRSVRAKIE